MSERLARWLALLICLSVSAIGLVVIRLVADNHRLQLSDITRELGFTQARIIEEHLNRSLSATYALASIVQQSPRIDNFDQLAADMMALYGGVDALFLAPDGIVSLMHPVRGNEAAFGHNLLEDPERRTEALAAIETRQLYLAGPVQLRQGGVGVIGRYPVFVTDPRTGAERFWGFTAALINLESLLAVAHLDDLSAKGYDYELTRADPNTGARIIIDRSSSEPLANSEVVSVTVPGTTWELALAPHSSGQIGLILLAERALALAGAALLAVLAYQFMRKTAALSAEIEDHRRTTEELREQQQFIDNVLAALTIPFYVIDASDYTVKYANRAAAASPLPGITCYALNHHSDHPCQTDERPCPLPEIRRTRQPVVVEHVHQVDGETRTFEIFGYPIFDARGELVQMIEYIQDVTERKRVQQTLLERETLRIALEKERELNKTQALFMMNASHQIRTPLTMISTATEMLLAYWDRMAAEQRTERLSIIAQQVNRLGRMLDDISTIISSESRALAATLYPLDLGEWCARSVARFNETLENGQRVSLSTEGDLPRVNADANLLDNALRNLLDNAAHFSPAGGEIRVRLCAEGQGVTLAVSDDGPGIDAEDLPHIFEPYYRGRNASSDGTGLGLIVVQEIVKLCGGSVAAESVPGQGATFRIWLPAIETAQVNMAQAESA